MSNRGICADCARLRLTQNHIDLTTRSGAYWRLWRKQMAASVGGVLLDDNDSTV